MRIWPDSLFGRLIAALLAAVGLTVVIVVILITKDREALLFQRSEMAALVELIATETARLESMPQTEREQALISLQAEGLVAPFEYARANPGQLRQQDPGAAANNLERHLRRELGADFAVSVGFPSRSRTEIILVSPSESPEQWDDSDRRPWDQDRGRSRRAQWIGGLVDLDTGRLQLDVSIVPPGDEPLRFRVPVPGEEPSLPTAIFGQLALLTAVLGGVLFVMARTITNPLADLSRAAEALGRGIRQLPLQETGSKEIRETTRAFNVMQERLNRYVESRTRVLSAMSHDLRTPLTRLKLRVEQLNDPVMQERFNADLDSMNDMVSGALDALKGISDTEALAPTDINSLLEGLRSEFAEADASVTVSGAASLPIMARPHLLKRCLENLLCNAVNYGASAEVNVLEKDDEILIRIDDEGPGIPDRELEKVFEPYFRLEGSRNQNTGGVGLGLSIARDIAQAHGGTLTLTNRRPHGLRAELSLPQTKPA